MSFLKILRTGARRGPISRMGFSTTLPCVINHRNYRLRMDKPMEESMKEFLDKFSCPEPNQWIDLRSQILNSSKRITNTNVDATIVGYCVTFKKLEAAKCFVEFLEQTPETGGVNIVTLTRLLKVYHAAASDRVLTDEEENEIIEIYEQIRRKVPVFDANTAEGVIFALSLTSRWKECLELMQGITILSTPSIATYTSVVEAAFRNDEKEIALQTLRKSIQDSRIPKCKAFTAWIDFCQRQGEGLAEFLQFIAFNEMQISESVIMRIEKYLQSQGIRSRRTAVDPEGVCYTCEGLLKPIQLTDEEFQELQSQFLNRVLIREDVFLKSNPKEVENFRKFLSRTKPFDCIVDGLNVALSKGTGRTNNILATNLINVVMHFARKGQRVLVLGRKHMSNFPEDRMRMLRSNAHIFLTDNLSQDDPFLLYAALISGKRCCIVSKDLMRGHAYLLKSEELRNTFRRWQHTHQFRWEYTPGTKVIMQAPPTFSVTAHETDGHWHVPFQSEYSPHQLNLFEIPENWLCFDYPGHCSAPERQ
ncbi:mitochondrial ribonuclease P catalytic subunit-like [Phlebotomus argentipes]|uniref:mitochondrial ribonuclease P catalytic subunit-like n=1 Tax=Phlebotomus argentipes TaxID=94469 RepID=UPI002893373D|nr:mitochondrial ribonuclease P catalytic subunit-like [Phlebotomus argentipes]